MPVDLDVAVVGAGVAGLAVANSLRRAGHEVRVFESADHVGGRMATVHHDGYHIDTGAEQISDHGYELTWQWLRRLGVPPAEIPLIRHGVGMWRDGRAHPGVAHPLGLVTGAGLSLRGRLDLARFMAYLARHRRDCDPNQPQDTPFGLATVAQLAERYHPDLGEFLFQPVVGGFFGWHPQRSAAAPFASLLAAVGSTTSWRTYRDGMDTLARRLAEPVEVRTGHPVEEIVSARGHARLVVGGATVTARSVVVCVPAPVAARLYRNPPEDEQRYLAACGYTPMMKVSCLLDRPLAPPGNRPLYILLTPAREERLLSGIIVDHLKHPARVPRGRGLLTLLASPFAMPELLEAPDDEVIRRLTERAERYVPGLRAATTANLVHRFRNGLPEATPAALALRAGFARRRTAIVDYAGDWVTLRPSSEGALRAAALAVERVSTQLTGPARMATTELPTDHGETDREETGGEAANRDAQRREADHRESV